MTAIRTRTRPAEPEGPTLTQQMRDAVQKVWEANKRKNAATRDENAAQKELDALMAKADDGEPWEFEHTFTPEYGDSRTPRTVDVEYAAGGVKEVVNVVTLQDKVDNTVFLSIVTASKAAVERHAGKNVVNACVEEIPTDFKARIKERGQ